MEPVPVGPPNLAAFQRALNTRFRISATAVPSVEATLVEVAEGRPSSQTRSEPAHPPYESFSLIFAGPRQQFLPQGTYTFESEQLGRFDLFIVPVGQTSSSIDYQAIFNYRPG